MLGAALLWCDRVIRRPTTAIVSNAGTAATPPAGRSATVSVIVPCFNYGRFLPSSVGSAVQQTGCTTEVIVVDDRSTDDSLSIARSLAADHRNVHVLANEHNRGHVATFNAGLEIATGDYIVRLDADDLLTPGCLERALHVFDAYPSVGLVYGRPHHFTSSEPPVPLLRDPTWTVWAGHDWIRERCRRGVNCITTPEAVIRGSVLRSIGELDPRLRFAQDMEIWLRTAAVSDVAYITGPDQALHRDHSTSMSVTVGSGIVTDLLERRTVFDVLFQGPGHQLPDAAQQQQIARRTLALEAVRHASQAYDRGRSSASEISELMDFAVETFPAITTERAWGALARRRRQGPEAARRDPLNLVASAVRRIDSELAFARWLGTGT